MKAKMKFHSLLFIGFKIGNSMKSPFLHITIITTFILSIASSFSQAQEYQYISIGTGGITGVYYPTGGAICRLVNKNKKEHGIRCSVESTGGSIFNLNAIKNGELDFGVTQSDWQYHAYQGSSTFKDIGANEKLRAVFSVHSEPFTVVARSDANIKHFNELKDKRVNVGNPGSGQRATIEVLLDKMGWTFEDFKLKAELKASEQARALCDNKIDAFVYTVGHPNGSIKEASTACDITLVNVQGEAVEELISENPYYAQAIIPADMYKGNSEDVTTFGVKATIVSSSDVPKKVVYNVVKAIFDNFDAFKQLHPSFKHLTPQQMLQGNSAPFHAGAEKFYKEKGWLK